MLELFNFKIVYKTARVFCSLKCMKRNDFIVLVFILLLKWFQSSKPKPPR